MRTVSTDFRNAMIAPVKEIVGSLEFDYADIDPITSADDLISFTIDGNASAVGKSVLRKLTAKYIGTKNIAGEVITAKFGVKIAGGGYEYLTQGEFLVSQCDTAKDTGMTTITAYDKMIYTVVAYAPEKVVYPTTVSGLYTQIAIACGLTVETSTIPFGDLTIDVDLYANISGTQYRQILEDIAILGGQVLILNESNQLAFRSVKTPTNTPDTLTYADLKKLSIKDKYGAVNSLVLSRQPQEDNVVLINETSVADDGLTEIKIANNEIIDKRREDVATDIFPYFDQTTYYPFKADTTGFGWYEVGDKINITDDESVTRESRVMGVKLTIDGSVQETISSDEPTKTQTNYARAGGLNNRIKNTEIQVDKQNQTIISVVSDLETLDGETSENFTEIRQDISSIIQSVQVTGGINLLRNSAFYQFDASGIPASWTTTGSGTINIQASNEAVSKGSLSGNIVTLTGVTEKQMVTVVQDNNTIPEDQKTYYSFKVLVKKGTLGTATVRIYNDNENYITTIPVGVSKIYDEVTFQALLPTQTFYWVELTGDSDSVTSFADSMFSVGKYPSAWQQANGEILNTNVNINENGMIVKSSVFAGDYTAITPLEFSGYAKVGGTVVKAFTLNKDQTEVKKLYASDEISTPNIKMVVITTGSVTGLAFVKRSV